MSSTWNSEYNFIHSHTISTQLCCFSFQIRAYSSYSFSIGLATDECGVAHPPHETNCNFLDLFSLLTHALGWLNISFIIHFRCSHLFLCMSKPSPFPQHFREISCNFLALRPILICKRFAQLWRLHLHDCAVSCDTQINQIPSSLIAVELSQHSSYDVV